MSSDPKTPQAYLETRRVGAIMQVKAVDAATGTEISFQAPANTPRSSLEKLALSKLSYVLKKQGN